MDQKIPALTIGALAGEAGVGVETIRYYQRRGLVNEPQRPYGGIRRYDADDVKRLRFIRVAQELGFSLNEVGELLELADGIGCEEAQRLASAKLEQVHARRAKLGRIETVLKELLKRCRTETGRTSCPLIEALEERSSVR